MARYALLVVVFLVLRSSGSSVLAQEQIWRSYIDLEGRAGSVREVGQGNLFLPLLQNENELIFADLRGQWTDKHSAEGNWGLAYRKILPSEWIVGVYGFYDVRHSALGNNFHQATFGAELLSVNSGFRLNGYIPGGDVGLVPGLNGAFLQGNNIVVRRGEERAYHGLDFEVERLLWTPCSCDCCCSEHHGISGWLANLDAELWAAAGMFHFSNDTLGFEDITGPRLRAELRLYDLPTLGNDSRLVASGQYEYDGVRGNVGTGMLSVRIPFGPGGGRRGSRLSWLNRRMVTPIVRDIDIITNVAAVSESAKVAHTGLPISNAVVIDASDDIVNEVLTAGANSVVIVDGVAGAFNIVNTVVLQDGQVVIGGGSQLAVVGCNTGTAAIFTGPGIRPTVNGTIGTNNVFQIANDSTLQCIDITGGLNGIFGNAVSGFTISDNNISGAAEFGVQFDGTVSGVIAGNTASANAFDGFNIFALSGGSVSDNTASGNAADGFQIDNLSGSSVSGNTASGNTFRGFVISTFSSGSLTDNMASGNGTEGIQITNFNGGSVSDNTATSNTNRGFFINVQTNGSLSDNTSNENREGFQINTLSGGSVTDNTATDNDVRGFFIGTQSDGSVTDNIATGNLGGGFAITSLSGGSVTDNTATGNTFSGLFIGALSDGSVSGNTSSGNTQGIQVNNLSGGSVTDNTATGNTQRGFFLGTHSGGSLTDNMASDNGTEGFQINTLSGGSVTENTATDNTNRGFFITTLSSGTLSDNTSNENTEGFQINTLSGGSVSNNTANDNTKRGFLMTTVNGGSLSDNMASGNMIDGFAITNLNGSGSVSNNTATDSTFRGFFINTISGGGSLTGNTVNGNATHGFQINTISSGTVTGNMAIGNMDKGYFISTLSGGSLNNNTASGNTDDGFFVGFSSAPFVFSGGTMSGNTASGNGTGGSGDGFDINFGVGNTAIFTSNSSTDNTNGAGYNISGTPATGGSNTGSGNFSDDTGP